MAVPLYLRVLINTEFIIVVTLCPLGRGRQSAFSSMNKIRLNVQMQSLSLSLPEILFRLSRKKEWSKPQAEERQHSWAERESRRGQRVHRAEPSVKILPI